MASKKVLVIGANGKVSRLALPKLKDAGVEVTGLVRNPDYEADLKELGASDVVVKDITKQTPSDWAELFADFDVVVWSAGNGGRAGAEATTAIDRDGELAVITALELMDERPYYVTVNYLGWDSARVEGDPVSESWPAYVDAKKTVGARLGVANVDHVILAPSVLTDDPAGDSRVVDNDAPTGDSTTSRELVADQIVEYVINKSATSGTVAFIDA